jgi:hypothetical protein
VTKRKRGRPKKEDHVILSERIFIRMTADDVDALYRAAFKSGCTLASLVRDLILDSGRERGIFGLPTKRDTNPVF